MFLIASTLVGAAALVFCEVVSFLAPSKFPATFVIALSPAFIPSFVTDTFVFPLGVIVNPVPSNLDTFPSLSVTVVPVGVVTTEFPAVSLTSTLVKSVNSCFNE